MKRRWMLFWVACLVLPAYGSVTGLLGTDGRCEFMRDGRQVARVSAGYFLPGWRLYGYAPLIGKSFENRRLVTYGGERGKPDCIRMAMEYERLDAKSLRFSYVFTPEVDTSAYTLFASLEMPCPEYLNRPFRAEGRKAGVVPSALGNVIHLFRKKVRTFGVDSGFGGFDLTLDEPKELLFQDNRQWSNTLSIRIDAGRGEDTKAVWKKGVGYRVSYVLTFPEEVELTVERPVTLKADADWIPLTVPSLDIQPGSALDFSQVVKLDAPAGKYGYLKAEGPHFAFEGKPGVMQRFYGVNFCFSAHSITPEQSGILATRLARLGYNAVRYHHYERAICRQDLPGDSTQLDPEGIAKFDAMFAAMKARGLYATTDMFVSRNVYESEVYEGGDPKRHVAMNTFKNLCAFSPRARENWKRFSRHLLTHVNPHTGLSYAKDPSLPLISLINEGPLTVDVVMHGDLDPRFKAVVLKAWNDWYRTTQKGTKTWTELPRTGKAAHDVVRFLAYSEQLMLRELGGYLRKELGCRALISNLNCSGKDVVGALARSQMDYVDDHFYVDHPSFVRRPWSLPSRCNNSSVVRWGRPGGSPCMFSRLVDKPFTITEWNYSGPGRYRGVGGILTGCMASIQDWSGLWRFAYSHGSSMFRAHPMGYFDLKSDPLNQAADRASILLYLRRDLASAAHTVAGTLDRKHLEDGRYGANRRLPPHWNGLGLLCNVGMFVGNAGDRVPGADVTVSYSPAAPRGKVAFTDYREATTDTATRWLLEHMRQKGWLPADNRTDITRNVFQTLDGQFTMDAPADTMILNTPRTAGGFAPAGTTVKTAALDVTMLDTDATVWVSSLSDAPIATSKRLLLTHLTDLQNTEQRYNDQGRRMLLSWGRLPYLVRNGRAEILLRLSRPQAAQVWVIDTCGRRVSRYPSQATSEGLTLTLSVSGGGNARLMYEIEVE